MKNLWQNFQKFVSYIMHIFQMEIMGEILIHQFWYNTFMKYGTQRKIK